MSGTLLRHLIRRIDPRIRAMAAKAHRQFEVYKENMAVFWTLHGANMMASNYDEGTWTPLFENIYEGEAVSLPSLEQGLDIAIRKFWSDEEGCWQGEGRAVGAWLVLEEHTKFGYYLSGLVELQQGGDPQLAIRAPHNDIIWRMFNALKHQVLDAVQEESHARESDPESGPDVQYQPSGDLVAP